MLEEESLVDLLSRMTYEKRIGSYSLGKSSSQERRREERLAQQKHARKDLTNKVRFLLLSQQQQQLPQQPPQIQPPQSQTLQLQPSQSLLPQSHQQFPSSQQPQSQPPQSHQQFPPSSHRIEQTISTTDTATTMEEISKMERRRENKSFKQEQKLIEKYKDNLMVPEQLEQIPFDLATQWICVPYPSGRRCLVVASNGNTVSRLRNGNALETFKSLLPGGGGRWSSKKEYCFLDCVLHEPSFTYYVLDMMCWRGNLYYSCDTEFRFYWINTKLTEDDDVSVISEKNQFRIVPLPRHNCDTDALKTAFDTQYPFPKTGYLFYHKSAHYTFDSTPLMCYLPHHLMPSLVVK